MERHPVLNFPYFSLRTALRGGVPCVWDDLRGKWLQLTPEEWVRRHLIHYLAEEMGADRRFIVQEYPVLLQGQPQRADVVVMASGDRIDNLLKDSAVDNRIEGAFTSVSDGSDLPGVAAGLDTRPRPLLLAECKAADVPIDQGVFAQAVRYNSVVGACFLVLTNGMRHYCYQTDSRGGYRQLSGMPDLSVFFGER